MSRSAAVLSLSLSLLLTSALVACGEPARGPGVSGASDVPPETVVPVGPDAPLPPNVSDPGPVAEIDVTEGCEEGPPPECQPTSGAGGGFMCECGGNADCDSGICVQTRFGKVCSKSCVECCPDGFSCELLGGTCPDCKYACAPVGLNLCRPCDTNAECENPQAPQGERCVRHGDIGSFCGISCELSEDCPEGYGCEDVETVSGSTTRQCVPIDGTFCECSAFAIEQGAQTTCSATNELGSCAGKRECTAAGLGACDAATPTAEECDGIDNDCDGLFDEGTCPSGEVCACSDAGCACGCAPGQLDCGSGCVDVNASVKHCGDCNAPCEAAEAATFVCADGQCGIAKCAAGHEDLNGVFQDGCECVIEDEICDGIDNDCDGQTDEGELCLGEEGCEGQCVEGACACPEGCDACLGTCVSTTSYVDDPNHCGYCGNKCALLNTGIHTCEAGVCCAAVCATGFKDCNQDCTDGCEWPIAPEICDGVDNDCNGAVDDEPLVDCKAPKVCTSGQCICDPAQPDLELCEGLCVDATSDKANCGWCGNDCSQLGLPNVTAYECVAGECLILQCGNPWYDADTQSFNGCECEKTAAAETCDGLDNDCDGVVDQYTKPCTSACGDGISECAAGGWTPCDAPGSKQCKNYGTCEIEPMCVDACPAPPAEACNAVDDNCNGTVDEGFTCIPGDGKELPCGNCGLQAWICNSGCEWEELGECVSQGPCAPGAKDIGQCGNCGSQTRVCNDQCQWDEYGACQGQGDCAASATEEQACGLCGTQTRQCNAACLWEGWGACGGEGSCSPGLSESESCGLCGSRTRDCSESCGWGQWSDCGGQGACSPQASETKACGDCGIQARVCNASCGWDGWSQCESQGACTPGEVENEACGNCGSRSRKCTDSCTWGGWSSCGGQGVCQAGDEDSLPCGMCGAKTRTCKADCSWGNYGTCATQGQCTPGTGETESCGACGSRTRSCTPQCLWASWSSCGGQGQCAAGTAETVACGDCGSKTRLCSGQCTWGKYTPCSGSGICSPGEEQTEACGNCGSRTRTCTGSCGWGGWSSCTGQGVCKAGSSSTATCGNCGNKSRTCTNQCTWGAYGSCGGQGVCQAGSQSTTSCGNCGSKTRTCSSSCSWGGYGSCGGQGVCSSGSTQSASCGNCGTKTRTCSGSCSWNSYGSCGGQGTCSPSTSQACPSACGSRTCSSACSWGSCNFTKDAYEPNENYSQATLLGTFSEGGGIPAITTAWLHQAEPAIASPGEIDRYYFYCNESGNIFDWSMEMKATLSTASGWHKVCLFYDRGCNGSVEVTKCSSGYGAQTASTGDVDGNNGSDDDGCIDVEVYGDWSCAAYTLQMSCN